MHSQQTYHKGLHLKILMYRLRNTYDGDLEYNSLLHLLSKSTSMSGFGMAISIQLTLVTSATHKPGIELHSHLLYFDIIV